MKRLIAGLTLLALPLLTKAEVPTAWEEVFLTPQDSISDLDVSYNTMGLRARLGSGNYDFLKNQTINRPIEIIGNGESRIQNGLSVNNYLDIKDCVFESDSWRTASGIWSNQETYISNCRFTGYANVTADSIGDVRITDNVFEPSSELNFAIALFEDMEKDIGYNIEPKSINLRNNVFKDCKTSILTYMSSDLGTSEDSGNNVFENCITAIDNRNPEGKLTAINNYFAIADTQTKADGSLRILELPEDIIANQIKGYTDNVEVSGTRWKMIPKNDWNDDDKVNSIDVQVAINEALRVPCLENELTDQSATAITIQETINSVLGL